MIDRTSTETLLAETAVAFRRRRDLLIAEGNDAAEYLHGQVSQSVTGLAVGDSAWSLLLSPQGKVDAWMRITRVADQTFWLDLDEGFGEEALARLNRFKLRVDAELTLHTVPVVAVRGPAAAGHRPDTASTGPDATSPAVIDLLWGDLDGFDLLGEGAEVPAGLEVGDDTAFDALRIQAATPMMGAEIVDNTIPAEVGVVDASADFTKGCYVGQELVARVDSRGNNTPRTMRRMRIDGHGDTVGLELVQGGESVGVVTSAAPAGADTVALVSVKRAADLDGAFAIAAPDGERSAVLLG